MRGAFNALNAAAIAAGMAACGSTKEDPAPLGPLSPPPLSSSSGAASVPADPIFVCPGGARAKVTPDLALVIDGDEALRLPRGGTLRRFETEEASLVVGGGIAVLERPGQPPRRCALTSGAPEPPALPLRAGGNEPSWSLRIGPEVMTMETDYGAVRATVPTPEPRLRGRIATWEATSLEGEIRARISPGPCRDNMSGMPFPFGAEVWLDGDYHRGCAGEPKDLLIGEWTPSGPVFAGREAPRLAFGADGTVNGTTGCNQLSGPYALTGEGLTIGPVATTRRACFGETAKQEAAFLEFLRGTYRFEIEPDGALVLVGETGELELTRSTR